MAVRTIEIDSSSKLSDQQVTTLLALAQQLYDAVPLLKFELTRMEQDPASYRYEITTVDGRTWTQDLLFDPISDPDPPMTFEVPQGWRRLAEFTFGRDLRNHLVTLINTTDLVFLAIEWPQS